MFNFDLSTVLYDHLLNVESTSEFELIRYCQSKNILPKNSLSNHLALFKTHFLVYNGLFRLKADLLIKQQKSLNISPLEIKLAPVVDSNVIVDNNGIYSIPLRELSVDIALAQYYLDLTNLYKANEKNVAELLNKFWQLYTDPSEKNCALAVLQLTPPVDFDAIKKQYRRLVMQHHPDRGGNPDILVEINRAMKCLEQYY